VSADDGRDGPGTDRGVDSGTDRGADGNTEANADADAGGSAVDRDDGVTTPPLPVRKPLPVRGAANPALLGPTAEELAADQPSVEMLRRVRRALRALPEPD
jgi:hypothetical protein